MPIQPDLLQNKRVELDKAIRTETFPQSRIIEFIEDPDYLTMINGYSQTIPIDFLQANTFQSPMLKVDTSRTSDRGVLYEAQNMLRLFIEVAPVHTRLSQARSKSLNVQTTETGKLKIVGLNLEFDCEKVILGACFNSSRGLPYLHLENGYVVSKTILDLMPETLSVFVIKAFEEFERTHKKSEFKQNPEVCLETIPENLHPSHFAWIHRRLEQVKFIVDSVNINSSVEKKKAIESSFANAPEGLLMTAAWGVETVHIGAFKRTFDVLNSSSLRPIFHYLNYMELKAKADKK